MKNNLARFLALYCLLPAFVLLAAGAVQGQAFQKQADQYAAQLVQGGKFSGAVLVARQGKILLSKGYGYANKDSAILNNSATIFRIGSVTKPFTTVLVMQLVEEGNIELDAPLSTYLPELDEKVRPVTVRQLLQQTSGIGDYTETELTCAAFGRRPVAPMSFLPCLRELKPEFAPGSQFSYSNTNYFLLGVLLEKLTGRSFGQLLQERILQPLKMTRTGYRTGATKNAAQGYAVRDGAVVPAMPKDITRAYAAGGMYSTVEDLYRFDQALRNEKLLKRATLQGVFAENKTVDPSYYGFGWYVGPAAGYQDYRTFHEGGIGGFSACIDRYLDKDVCIIALSNFEFAEPRVDVTEPLTKMLLDQK
jgi:CubicO group peptidase (beta-lactamase class C family)